MIRPVLALLLRAVAWAGCGCIGSAVAADGGLNAPVQMAPMVIQGEVITSDPRQTEALDAFFSSYRRERVSGETVERESVGNVTDLIERIPGVTITPSGPLVQRPEIRGLGGERVLTVVDGVRIGNQGLSHNGGGDANLVDPAMIDYVEVIKGSPAVLYDPGASGGIVNIRLKSPGVNDRQASVKGRLDMDSGLDSRRWNLIASGATHGLSGLLQQSWETANDYRVTDQAILDERLRETNVREERLGTPYEIKDLGYRKRNLGVRLGYALPGDLGRLHVGQQRYRAEDIWFTHAGSNQLFFRDRSERAQSDIGYRLEELGPVHDLAVSAYRQRIENTTHTGYADAITELNTRGALAYGSVDVAPWRWTLGLEFMRDEATTNVLAEQRYRAAFVQGERGWGPWLASVGVRLNDWLAEARERPGRDPELVEQLVGVTGVPGDNHDSAPTYALGLIYSLTDQHNLTFNYSRTYRFPNLYERYAADGFYGGGVGLAAERAHNLELGWRYYRTGISAALALFYTRFADYIETREVRRLVDQPALADCIAAGRCEPAVGDYDEREDEFFSSAVFFENFARVNNRGLEFALEHWASRRYELGLNVFVSDFKAADPAAEVDENPLEVNLTAQRFFPIGHLSPWLKTRLRYVSDWPTVSDPDFQPFLLINAYAGLDYQYRKSTELRLNLGLRNLGNTHYREPHTVLPGLRRSWFGGVQAAVGF